MRWIDVLFALIVSVAAGASPGLPRDPRFAPITKGALSGEIRAAGANVAAQFTLIDRAENSGLAEQAYAQYTRRWQQKPADAVANLLRGYAALDLWHERIWTHWKEANPLMVAERQCFRKAVELAPDMPEAMREYGFFLWQYDEHMDEGLAMLRKAAKRIPNDARVHLLLGSVYSNSSGNAYDPGRATIELREAIRLDPSYSRPRYLLMLLYIHRHDWRMAKEEKAQYLSLLPAGAAQKPRLKPILQYIDKQR